MKNKVLITISMIFIISSCKIASIVRYNNKQKISYSHSNVNFELVNNRIIVKDKFHYLLDIGAPNGIFKKNLKDFTIIDSISIGKMATAKGEKLDNKFYIVDSLNLILFTATNYIARSLDLNFGISCSDNVKGIIGNEAFINNSLYLNFDEKYLTTNNLEIKNLSTLTLKKFDGYDFIITLNINGKDFDFKVDTGNVFDIIMCEKDFEKIPKKTTHFLLSTQNNIEYCDSQVTIASDTVKTRILNISKLKYNLIGINLIKRFNWYFDYKNGKIYTKRNTLADVPYGKNRVAIKNKKLLINHMDSENKKEIKSNEILSINNEKVTSNNICAMMQKLNEANDWSQFEIEIKE